MGRLAISLAGAGVGYLIGGPAGARLGFTAGSVVGGLIFQNNTNQNIDLSGPKLPDAQVQTSREGVPIPIVWGVEHVAGNIIQIGPLTEETQTTTTTQESSAGGGKGGGATSTTTTTSSVTRRKRTFAIGVARSSIGEIQGILRIWEYDKLVYDARPSPAISAADHAAFAAQITIHLGGEDESPDSDLESISGVGTTPSYKGLAYVVFKNYDITDFGSVIPQYRFEIDAGGSTYLTSQPYPIEQVDEIESAGGFKNGRILGEELVAIDSSFSFVTGDLHPNLVEYSNPNVDLDSALDYVSGDLAVKLKTANGTPAEMDSGLDYVSGDLYIGLVTNDMTPDLMDSGLTFVSGTLG